LKPDKPLSEEEFNRWHEQTLNWIRSNDRLPTGWAAKIVNVYLKSMCYLSGIGRQGLVNHIHPPIDSGLWKGLEKRYKSNSDIWSKVYSKTKIKDIKTYSDYSIIINGMKEIAYIENCLLIDIEQFWEGTLHREKNDK
jgi:hypothetical protein